MSALWLVYGCIIADSFVHVPNLIGFMIAVFQLGLFMNYPRIVVGLEIEEAREVVWL